MKEKVNVHPWVKRLGQWHIALDGQHTTICGKPMLGNNYAKVIPARERTPCEACHGTRVVDLPT